MQLNYEPLVDTVLGHTLVPIGGRERLRLFMCKAKPFHSAEGVTQGIRDITFSWEGWPIIMKYVSEKALRAGDEKKLRNIGSYHLIFNDGYLTTSLQNS